MARKFLVAHEDEKVAAWICKRIPMFEYGSTPYTCLGLANHLGGLIAGVIYENYNGLDIRMHVATEGKRWLTRHFLGEVFRYPFIQLGCRRVTGLVPASNAKAIEFDEHLGFIYEGCIRRMLPNGEDLLIYGMLKEECRWLEVGVQRGYGNQFPVRQTAKSA